jgi:hypothetical protein
MLQDKQEVAEFLHVTQGFVQGEQDPPLINDPPAQSRQVEPELH